MLNDVADDCVSPVWRILFVKRGGGVPPKSAKSFGTKILAEEIRQHLTGSKIAFRERDGTLGKEEKIFGE